MLDTVGWVVLAANLLFFPDLLDVLIRLVVRASAVKTGGFGLDPDPSVSIESGAFTPYQKRLHLRPLAIVASVHNAEDELPEFVEAMAPYGRHLWTIDDASDDETVRRIRGAGYRCLIGTPNRKKPGAIKELVRSLPDEIETVVVLDPDCSFVNSSTDEATDLEKVVFDFQRSGMSAVCPRIAVRQDGLLSDFQAFEFCMSQLLGRKSLSDFSVNSGISIYRREELEWLLERHSLSVYAEDLENSVILLGAGRRIYFDDRLIVETEGKQSLSGLFSQRVGWAFGHIRVFSERFSDIRRIASREPMAAYQFLLYLGVVGMFVAPFRALAGGAVFLSLLNTVDEFFLWGVVPDVAITAPALFLSVYLQYLLLSLVVLLVAVPRGERRRYVRVFPLFFFYSVFLIAPTLIGFGNWITMRLMGRRVFQDHYQDEEGLASHVNGDRIWEPA